MDIRETWVVVRRIDNPSNKIFSTLSTMISLEEHVKGVAGDANALGHAEEKIKQALRAFDYENQL